MIQLTNQQARQFLLLKQGLFGEYRFVGKQGALEYVRQAGSIQFDPVDVCGKNPELVLQSRVKDFTKQMLQELLYTDRLLVDYPDKNLCILPVEAWPWFRRYRDAAGREEAKFPEMAVLKERAKAYIAENGPVCSDDLPGDGSIRWHSAIHWSGDWNGKTNAARAVLEQMYANGELVIHHKVGTRKYYDLAEKHLSSQLLLAPEPLPDEFEHRKWRVLRRIGAVGLLWNRPSDAWLSIWGLTSPERTRIFTELLAEGKIVEVQVEDLKPVLYCRREDVPLLEKVRECTVWKFRCELIAPLDCFLWDRKLIRTLFDFDYQWEIYTPAVKRKYGPYVLPILYGDRFVGRLEAAADKKVGMLTVKDIWYEPGIKQTKKLQAAVDTCLKRFAKFNECGCVRMERPTQETTES